jgi:hypothetical protein
MRTTSAAPFSCQGRYCTYARIPSSQPHYTQSLLSTALDDADPDSDRITEILDAIPGAWRRTQEGLAQAEGGEGTPLDELAWVAQVFVTPRAQRDWTRRSRLSTCRTTPGVGVARSLRTLETLPLAGAELTGGWAPVRFVLGPWSWTILLYRYEELSDQVYVVAMHGGRSATSATTQR